MRRARRRATQCPPRGAARAAVRRPRAAQSAHHQGHAHQRPKTDAAPNGGRARRGQRSLRAIGLARSRRPPRPWSRQPRGGLAAGGPQGPRGGPHAGGDSSPVRPAPGPPRRRRRRGRRWSAPRPGAGAAACSRRRRGTRRARPRIAPGSRWLGHGNEAPWRSAPAAFRRRADETVARPVRLQGRAGMLRPPAGKRAGAARRPRRPHAQPPRRRQGGGEASSAFAMLNNHDNRLSGYCAACYDLSHGFAAEGATVPRTARHRGRAFSRMGRERTHGPGDKT
ncbi:exported hypothetical protein [uncultured Defluviicoccus sp.]|uniref:Uncharacterized protein n=1 Tax=metagenome TaxID=256318 RepID=A0A380THH3_9ZZZZ|nr:exported hypothetical protein [uncultured Defluviicoccus sp.]